MVFRHQLLGLNGLNVIDYKELEEEEKGGKIFCEKSKNIKRNLMIRFFFICHCTECV